MRVSSLQLLLALGSSPLAAQATAPPPRPIAIVHVTLIDGTGAPTEPDVTVLIEGNRISQIGPSRTVRPPAGSEIVEGRGRYLIPGLWDMHVHMAGSSLFPHAKAARPLAVNWDYFAPLLMSYGITGVRDMAGDLKLLSQWRDEVAAGTRLGPRMVVTGRKLGKLPVVPAAPNPVKTEAEVRQVVDLLKADGADFVKVDGLDGALFPALAAETRKLGFPFVGHTSMQLGARGVSEAGQKSIEHLDGVVLACAADEAAIRRGALNEDTWWGNWLVRLRVWRLDRRFRQRYQEMLTSTSDPKADSLIAVFQRNHTWQTPTLVMLRDIRLLPQSPELMKAVDRYDSSEPGPPSQDIRWQGDSVLAHAVYAREVSVLGRMIRAGVPILAGTDTPGGNRVPGASLSEELGLLVDAGLTPMQALQSATRQPAEFLGSLDSLGTVERGKLADLTLLDADPLADIRNTRRVAAVVLAGRLLPADTLAAMRERARAQVSAADSIPR